MNKALFERKSITNIVFRLLINALLLNATGREVDLLGEPFVLACVPWARRYGTSRNQIFITPGPVPILSDNSFTRQNCLFSRGPANRIRMKIQYYANRCSHFALPSRQAWANDPHCRTQILVAPRRSGRAEQKMVRRRWGHLSTAQRHASS